MAEFRSALSVSREHTGVNGLLQHEVGSPLTYRIVQFVPVSFFISNNGPPLIPVDLLLKKGSDLYGSLCANSRTDMLCFIASQCHTLNVALRICGLPIRPLMGLRRKQPQNATPLHGIDLPFARSCGVDAGTGDDMLDWLELACRGRDNRRHCVRMRRDECLTANYIEELFYSSLIHVKRLLVKAVSQLSLCVLRWVRTNLSNARLYSTYRVVYTDLVDGGAFHVKKQQSRSLLTGAMRMEYLQQTLAGPFIESDVESISEDLIAEALTVSKTQPQFSSRVCEMILEIVDWVGLDAWIDARARRGKLFSKGVILAVGHLCVAATSELRCVVGGRWRHGHAALKSLVCVADKYGCQDELSSISSLLTATRKAIVDQGVTFTQEYILYDIEAVFDELVAHIVVDGCECESCLWMCAHTQHFCPYITL